MSALSLVSSKLHDDHLPLNQSALTTTGTTIPLYPHEIKLSHYINKKSSQQEQNYPSLISTKTDVFSNEDKVQSYLSFHDEKPLLDQRLSIHSTAFPYCQKPIRSSYQKHVPTFVDFRKSKKQHTLFRRVLFIFICLLVVILAIVITTVFIVRFA